MKGFTLVELLIVIAILAVLATTVAIMMNPAEMLREARDTQRISDLRSIQSAIALYLASVASPVFLDATGYCTNGTMAESSGDCATRAIYTTGGVGWVAVDLDDIPGGSPLSVLPRDPSNVSPLMYAFKAATTTLRFELVTDLESAKYAPMEVNDGGDNPARYEVGTNLTLF